MTTALHIMVIVYLGVHRVVCILDRVNSGHVAVNNSTLVYACQLHRNSPGMTTALHTMVIVYLGVRSPVARRRRRRVGHPRHLRRAGQLRRAARARHLRRAAPHRAPLRVSAASPVWANLPCHSVLSGAGARAGAAPVTLYQPGHLPVWANCPAKFC